MASDEEVNNTPFVDWFWKTAWLLGGHYTLADAALIYFEVEAKRIDNSVMASYVDYVMLADADCEDCGDVIVFQDWSKTN